MKIVASLLILASTTPRFVYPAPANAAITPFTTLNATYSGYVNGVLESRGPHECNSTNVQIRREWGTLSAADRIAYINAVKCLQSMPAQSLPENVPGAKNRYDDFVASHIIQAPYIHFTATLFPWHRVLVWEYEQALRNECGYTGAQPYWDWTLYYQNLTNSPLFDGSETSLGGNGEFIPHGPTRIGAFGLDLTLPPGTGGGVVTEGPFAYWTVNLGIPIPLSPPETSTLSARSPQMSIETIPLATANGTDDENLSYNPRNLTRDFQYFWSDQMQESDVEFLLSCADASCLEKRVDGWELGLSVEDQPRLHPAGHFTLGGLANDPFVSPGDPAFYFHHAQLDRMWTIWQAQDAEARQYQIGGTITPFDNPPSRNATLDDLMEFPVIGETITIEQSLNALSGKFCYIYE